MTRLEHGLIHDGRYPGGKNAAGTWKWIAGVMPPHSCYAEPFAGSFGVGRRKLPALHSLAIDRDAAVCRWLRSLAMPGLKVIRGCGIEWTKAHADQLGPDWLLYFDPPYPQEVRTKRRIYRHELSDRDHRRLLNAVTSLVDCQVIMSSYSSALYERRLAGWSRHERRVITRGGSWRTEVLWCNFDARPGAIDTPGVPIVGRDFRERERIKRLVARWRNNYGRRPEAERRAILAALHAAEASTDNPAEGGRQRQARRGSIARL